jgi:hypothetical protein
MGRIPVYQSQTSARSARTSGSISSQRASASAFGGDIAQAVGGFGNALDSVGAGMYRASEIKAAQAEKTRNENVANRVASADFTRTELEMRNTVNADADGYQDATLSAYDDWVDTQAEAIEDDAERTEFRQRMTTQRNAVSSRAATYELGTAAENSKNQANVALTALDNKIRLNPTDYDTIIGQGLDVIASREDLPATVREAMAVSWREGTALSRFEGMLESAKTVEDVRAVQEALNGNDDRDWSAELSGAGLERVKSLASSASTSIQTQADAAARAAIDTLEGRAADITATISREELAAVQGVVEQSGNPVTQARLARIVRDQDIIAQSRRLTPEQQRNNIEVNYNSPSLPRRVNAAVSAAASKFGIPASYLASTATREYGMYLTTGDGEDSIDYGKGNAEGASSATGIGQFIDMTWLGLVKNPSIAAQMGVDVSGMSDAQMLELRKDPEIAMMGVAALAKQSSDMIRRVTGRDATDAEMYMAHFMGGSGATRLLKMLTVNPDVEAAGMFPAQAEANPTVYYNKDGSARSVREVYQELGRKHGQDAGSETYVEYGDRQTRQDVLDDTERQLENDPMSFSQQVGNVPPSDVFGEGGMAQRGEDARRVADYYNIPQSDMKPFTEDEAASIGRQFKDGSADDVLAVLSSIQQMGGPMARAAMTQIGATDDVYAYAGGMQLETGQGSVASEIVRGQKRIEENPAIENDIGATRSEMQTAFSNYVGAGLMDVAPSQRQAIMSAAQAHYVETTTARGGAGRFDAGAFENSIQAVMGGKQGAPAIDKVNGQQTVLPRGVTGREMELAFENMTVADWATMSDNGKPPLYADGDMADPRELADDAMLSSIGGGKYRVMTSDGGFLITGDVAANGRLEAYIFSPTAERIKSLNSEAQTARETRDDRVTGEMREAAGVDADPAVRGNTQAADIAAAREDGNLSTDEILALTNKYGNMWAYNEDGSLITGAGE